MTSPPYAPDRGHRAAGRERWTRWGPFGRVVPRREVVIAVACPSCGADTRPTSRFCPACGTGLAVSCGACGATVEPGDRFCEHCGAPLAGSDGQETGTDAAPGDVTDGPHVRAPQTEVRPVSVLFVDLVGFTALSEGRDPERVRELLDAYFARARRVVERYGGTIEKFIGDAVMAVWGTPVVHDDDAERAVRAAMDLVADVAALGDEEEGLDGLHARAGVASGRAAVALGAEDQGMVAGDRVNTAARIQGAAPPGTVLVDETTQRATSGAVAYEDAGTHDLEGKDEAVRTWRAVRVIARRGGTVRAQGLEPPFVGRDRELRLVREVFETVVDHGAPALVSVVGQAGIGKSRLAWEFEKHLDGLVQTVYWHRGRCLSYGEGVAYDALAEMVRGRAGITEDEDPATARAELEKTVDEHVDDEDERIFVRPRLGQLLGLEEHSPSEQADLFAGWRLFFERLAERHPVVLVFEDIQWADRGLLDFIEHVLDRSRDHPILVLSLARPDIVDRVDWGAQVRNLTSIHLEPLSDAAMDALLAGLVPGLPRPVRERIAARAEGVPLYAVETVRMLLDRGQVVPGDDGYDVVGEIDELEAPDTLRTLVSARLDGLDPEVRDLAQHAAVLGRRFSRDGLAALSGLDADQVEEALATMRAKDLVAVDADARGTDGDRYTFLQAIVRTVAYETLSRHERKRRHLSAAAHLDSLPTADELAEVIAAHYLDAHRADLDAEDADEIRTDALRTLRRAADRAESLAAVDEAQRCWDRIVELADDPGERAEALLRAGELAHRAGRTDEASERVREAAEGFAARGDAAREALAEASLARIDIDEGRAETAVERLEAALDHLEPDTMPVEHARLGAELARQLYFLGQLDDAEAHVRTALAIAERERVLDVVCDALNTAALVRQDRGHVEQAIGLMRQAYALRDEAPFRVAWRAENNLIVLLTARGAWEEARAKAEDGLRRARREGDPMKETFMLNQLAGVAVWTGRLDEAERHLDEATEVAERAGRWSQGVVAWIRSFTLLRKGDLDAARRLVDEHFAAGFSDAQERLAFQLARVELLHRTGEHRSAVDEALAVTADPSTISYVAARLLHHAVASALAVGDREAADTLLERMRNLASPADPIAAWSVVLSEALIAAATDGSRVEERYRTALTIAERADLPLEHSVAQLELGEWLLGRDRADEAAPLLDAAEATLTEIGARLELQRLAELRDTGAPAVAAPG